MTYATGGPIQAVDYNTFATLTGGMNEIYADLHPGATTLPNASYGYGQTPSMVSANVGNPILASEWASLFQSIGNSGMHQGTTVVPPLPGTPPASVQLPVIGDTIIAYNTPASAITTLINTLRTNRYNVAALQSTLLTGTSYVQPAGAKPWANSLTFTYRADFGSWNNARYFFNSGGSLNLNGSYSPVSTPDDVLWSTLLSSMSPLVFAATSSTPSSGGNSGTGAGFYGLTTAYQKVYRKSSGGGGGGHYYYAYSSSYIEVNAKLAGPAGTSGIIDFKVDLVDDDGSPTVKNTTTTYRIDNKRATGAVTYPGPPVVITTVGANNGFTKT